MPFWEVRTLLKPLFGRKSGMLYFSYLFKNISVSKRDAEIFFLILLFTLTDFFAINNKIDIVSPVTSPIDQTTALTLQEKRKWEDKKKRGGLP